MNNKQEAKMNSEVKEEIRILEKKRDDNLNKLYDKKILLEHNRKIGEIKEDKGGWSFFTSEGFNPKKYPHCWYVTISCDKKELSEKGTFTSALPFDTYDEAKEFSNQLLKGDSPKP